MAVEPTPRAQSPIDLHKLVAEDWGLRPRLFRRPPSLLTVQPGWILDVLRSLGRRASSMVPSDVLIFREDGMAAPGRSHTSRSPTLKPKWFPSGNSTSLDEWMSLRSAAPGFGQFGYMVESIHQYDHRIWSATQQFLRQLYRYLPLPRNDINTNVFLGNYPHTPFGAHLDRLHNFMFMLTGTRRMLLWPYDVGLVHFESPNTLALDYERARKDAVVFDLEPGDILYWPIGFWHVGENQEGPSASFNIDYLRLPNTTWEKSVVARSIQSEVTALCAILPDADAEADWRTPFMTGSARRDDFPSLDQTTKRTIEALNLEAVQLQCRKALIQRMSSFGIRTPIPVRDSPPRDLSGSLHVPSARPLLTSTHGNRLLIGCNGHVLVRRDNAEWRALIERLNSGNPIPARLLDSNSAERLEADLDEPLPNKTATTALLTKLWRFRGLIPC